VKTGIIAACETVRQHLPSIDQNSGLLRILLGLPKVRAVKMLRSLRGNRRAISVTLSLQPQVSYQAPKPRTTVAPQISQLTACCGTKAGLKALPPGYLRPIKHNGIPGLASGAGMKTVNEVKN